MKHYNHQPKETSHEAYTKRQTEIETLLKKINTGLEMHKQTESKDEKNWGYAGDLEYIVSRLQDASDFLNNEGEYAEVAQW